MVFKPDTSPECHQRASGLRAEYVILVRGRVQRRSDETVNPKLPTGEVEVMVDELRVLNSATPPPFAIEDDPGVDESVRLRHRVHDLRRAPLQNALQLRHRLFQAVRAAERERAMAEALRGAFRSMLDGVFDASGVVRYLSVIIG